MIVLAGDVGGTRARFALCDDGKIIYEDVVPSQEYRSFEAALEAWQKRAPRKKIAAATFGIAGPVVDQRVKTTNLPWTIDAAKVARAFEIKQVTLLNDLVAVGLGALAAPRTKVAVLHRGRPKKTGGSLAVIAAGTGLGEAAFIWDGKRHVPCPTEGSHVEFAPRTAIEGELLEQLAKIHGHVSYERVASGSSLSMLYEFFARRGREPKAARAKMAAATDHNIAVVDLAESGESPAAARAIDLFASVYGAEAGNLALKTLSTAGVFVCGGVSTRLAKVLAKGLPHGAQQKSAFVEAFLDKGRMRPLLEKIPVGVVLDPRAGLLGAAAHAASLADLRRLVAKA